jgi:hypothetical protein
LFLALFPARLPSKGFDLFGGPMQCQGSWN